MSRINTVTDLIDLLEYVRREWGNDSPIQIAQRIDQTRRFEYEGKDWDVSRALYATHAKDGTVTITNFELGGEE